MADYNFETLNDMEFEELANDLISKKVGEFVERFKPGKDQGVDGRFFTPDGGEVIIQSKHYLKSGYGALLRHCKNTEADKVRKLNPARYILICSIPLSRSQKTELSGVFSPFLCEQDIFSKENLNDLLKDFPEVEKNHYKLWLSSTNVLESLLYADIDFDIQNCVDAIKRTSEKYVKTSLHDSAKKKLERDNCLVILGEPGIGKTTLARMLCYEYMATDEKYELVFIASDLKDANKKYREDKYQVFYFDDFLGNNHLEYMEDHKDSRLAMFIEKISEDPKKRFILTSRTTIFNQGINCSEKLERSDISDNKFCIHIDDLEGIDRARILYNHLYFAKDPLHIYYDHIANIIENGNYHHIIHHKNYSPRLIELILNKKSLKNCQPENYWNYIVSALDRPDEIWKSHIKKQISEDERQLLWFVSLSRRVAIEKLEHIFRDFNDIKYDLYRFYDAIKNLDGALIKLVRNRKTSNIEIELHNHSIRDYAIPMLLSRDINYLANMIVCMEDSFKFTVIPTNSMKKEIENLWDKIVSLITNSEMTQYKFYLSLYALRRLAYTRPRSYHPDNKKLVELFNDNVKVKNHREHFENIMLWYESNKESKTFDTISVLNYVFVISDILECSSVVPWSQLFNDAMNDYPDHNDFIEIADVLLELNGYDFYYEIEDEFIQCVSDYWESEIDSKVDDEFEEWMLYDGFESIYEEGMSKEDIDEDECYTIVESRIEEIIDDIIDEYGINMSITSGLMINVDIDEYNQKAISYLIDEIEEDKMPKAKVKAKRKTLNPSNSVNPVNLINQIDELFN